MYMYMVYWTSLIDGVQSARAKEFDASMMTQAMVFMEGLRLIQRSMVSDPEYGQVSFVTFCSENANCVTLPGVDSVVDGKTPDGHTYDWSKKHRGDGPKKAMQ
jgi:hypothetical protein